MAKVKVTIEETISQEFEVEVENIDNAYEEIRRKYKDGILVVENPALLEAKVQIGEDGDWVNLEV